MKPQTLGLLLGCLVCLTGPGCGPSKPRTSLPSAVQSGDYGAVRHHIAAHTDLNAKDTAGWTGLHLAAMKGDLPMVKLLAEAGANATPAGPGGKTPLDVAREKGKTSVVEYLEAKVGTPKAPRGRALIDGGVGVSEVLQGF